MLNFWFDLDNVLIERLFLAMNLSNKFTSFSISIAVAMGGVISHTGMVKAKEVRIYSGRHYNTDRQIYKRFSKETGIRVRLIEATGISLVERLKREGKNSNADLILLVDAARISNAAKEGLLQTYRSDKLDKEVPKIYRDPKGRWYSLTRRVRVLIAYPSKAALSSDG